MDLTSRPPLASILTRFGAILLDGLVVVLICLLMGVGVYLVFLSLIGGSGNETMLTIGVFLALLAGLGLQSYGAVVLGMWAYGLTPGMWMLGIRVVNRDSALPVGFWRMLLRQTFGQWIAAIPCYLGFIWAIFDANKQGWHDKIAKTLVIRTR